MTKPKIILGIETSCDETAAAVVQKQGNRVTILSNIVTSSATLQAKYGGIIPEQAAREQLKSIIPVISEALKQANITPPMCDVIAVTQGPGLIGSLLVGVETAKVLALVWDKPLIPVNHLIGHFYANWIKQSSAISYQLSAEKQKESDDQQLMTDDYPTFPCIGLLVSGGHTDLVLFKDHGKYQYLGGTRDDASGECFDKCARLLDLPYPGGPNLSKLAEKGNPKAYNLPRPMLDSKDLDFSFSGLKTAVSKIISENSERQFRKTQKNSENLNIKESEDQKNARDSGNLTFRSSGYSGIPSHSEFSGSESFRTNLAASIEDAITDVLVDKAVKAIQTYHVAQLIVAGGVAANQILAQKLTHNISKITPRAWLHIPPPSLCTDNAAMIAIAALYNPHTINSLLLQADPNLSLS